jgi:hypothetical protein
VRGVGLFLGVSHGALAAASVTVTGNELWVQPAFDDSGGITLNGWGVSSGVATSPASTGAMTATALETLTAGTYQVILDSSFNLGVFQVAIGNTTYTSFNSTNGVQTKTITVASVVDQLIRVREITSDGGYTITSLSVKKLTTWPGTTYSDYAFAFDPKNGVYRDSANGLITDPTLMTGYSYTRSGAKSEVGSSGSIFPFAANVPGIVNGDGYWSRGSLTNLLIRSQEFDIWGLSNTTVSANALAAPDGTLTADTLTTSSAGHSAALNATVVASTAYTVSWWAKRGTMTDAKYQVFDNTGGLPIIDSTSYYSTINSSTWARVTINFTTPAGCVSARIRVLSDSGVTGTIHLWQAQLVAGTQAGPVIVTTGATATVGADFLRTASSVADEDQVIIAKFYIDSVAASAAANIFDFNDTTSNNRLVIYTGGAYMLYVQSNAVNYRNTAIAGSPPIQVGESAVAIRRRSGKFTAYFRKPDGTIMTEAEGAAMAMPLNISSVALGSNYGGGGANNFALRFVGVKRGTFSDAELTTILTNA